LCRKQKTDNVITTLVKLLTTQNTKIAWILALVKTELAVGQTTMHRVPGLICLAKMLLIPCVFNFVLDNAEHLSVISSRCPQSLGFFLRDCEENSSARHAQHCTARTAYVWTVANPILRTDRAIMDIASIGPGKPGAWPADFPCRSIVNSLAAGCRAATRSDFAPIYVSSCCPLASINP
jgi:hypothetical protein